MPESPIVYHGTFAEFEKFDKSKLGSFTGAPSAYEGFFFASNKKVAVSYASDLTRQLRENAEKADTARKEIVRITGDSYFTALHKAYLHKYSPDIINKVYELNEIITEAEDLEWSIESIPVGYDYELDPSGRIIKARLFFNKPLIYDMEGKEYRTVRYIDLIKKAKSEGYDGLIIKNTYDGANPTGNLIMTDIYVAFDVSQIKIIDKKKKAKGANKMVSESMLREGGMSAGSPGVMDISKLTTEQKYARIMGLPEEDISSANYDMINQIFTIVYGIDKPRHKQTRMARGVSKEFADFFKAPIFVGKSLDYILTAYLKAKEKYHGLEPMIREGETPAAPDVNGIVNKIIQEVKEKPWTVPEKRAEIVARLKSTSDEIDRKIVTEIRSFRPLGTLSEFGAAMGAEPKKGVRIDTLMGATIFDEKRVPSKERVDRWDAEHKKAERIRGLEVEYAFALDARPNTVTGNYRVVEQAQRLKAQGFLTPEEEKVLEALEKYWQDHPEFDRKEGYGVWAYNLEIMVPERLKAKTASPSPPAPKQPWEMTYREFADFFEDVWGGQRFTFAEKVGKPLGIESQAGVPYHMILGRKIGYSGSSYRDVWRLAIVDRALSEGKKVPEEVLADVSEALKHEKEKFETIRKEIEEKKIREGGGMAKQYEEKPPTQDVKNWMKRALGIEDYKGGRHDRIQMLALLIQNSELGNIRSISDAGSMALALGKDLEYGTPPPYGKSFERYYAEKIAAETGREVPIIKSSDIIKPPSKEPLKSAEELYSIYTQGYAGSTFLGLAQQDTKELADSILFELRHLNLDPQIYTRDILMSYAAKFKELAQKEWDKIAGKVQAEKEKKREEEARKLAEENKRFWDEVKELKIVDVQVEFAPGESARGYKNIYLYTYVMLENGRKVRVNEEMYKGTDVAKIQRLGTEAIRKERLYRIGKTLKDDVRESTFLDLNSYEEYIKQVPVAVQQRFGETGAQVQGQPKKLYRYYYRNRPPGIGTQPEGFINHESWLPAKLTPHGRTAFGWVEYDRPLASEETSGFELFEDEVELPRLVNELVQFARDEGIDEAMKAIDAEYGRAVWEFMKAQKRIMPGLGQKEQIRNEIMRLAGITEPKDKFAEIQAQMEREREKIRSSYAAPPAVPAGTEELNRRFGDLIKKAKTMWRITNIQGWIDRYNDPRRSREDTILDLEGLIKTMEKSQAPVEAKYDAYIRSTLLNQGVLASPKFMSDEKIAQDIERNIQVSLNEARQLVPQFRAIAEKRINREEAESVKELFGIDVEQEAHNLGIDLADYAIVPAGNRVFLQHKTIVQKQYELKPPAGYMKRREEERQEKYQKAAGRASLTVKEPEDYYSGTEVTVSVGEPPKFLNGTLERLLDRGETVEVRIYGETNTIKVPIDRVRVRKLVIRQPVPPAPKGMERPSHIGEIRTFWAYPKQAVPGRVKTGQQIEAEKLLGVDLDNFDVYEFTTWTELVETKHPELKRMIRGHMISRHLKADEFAFVKRFLRGMELPTALQGLGQPLPAPVPQPQAKPVQEEIKKVTPLSPGDVLERAVDKSRWVITEVKNGVVYARPESEPTRAAVLLGGDAREGKVKGYKLVGFYPFFLLPTLQPAVPPAAKPVQSAEEIKQQAVASIQEAKTVEELQPVLKGIGFLPLTEQDKQELIRMYQNKYSTLMSERPFGAPVKTEEEKPRVLGAPTPQQRFEEEERKKAAAKATAFRGQQKLTSGASVTKRLEEFGIKERMNPGLTPSMRERIRGAQAIRDVIHYFRDGRPPIRGVAYRARDGSYFVEANDGNIYDSMGWEDVEAQPQGVREPAWYAGGYGRAARGY